MMNNKTRAAKKMRWIMNMNRFRTEDGNMRRIEMPVGGNGLPSRPGLISLEGIEVVIYCFLLSTVY
jgi:hypothetical protein